MSEKMNKKPSLVQTSENMLTIGLTASVILLVALVVRGRIPDMLLSDEESSFLNLVRGLVLWIVFVSELFYFHKTCTDGEKYKKYSPYIRRGYNLKHAQIEVGTLFVLLFGIGVGATLYKTGGIVGSANEMMYLFMVGNGFITAMLGMIAFIILHFVLTIVCSFISSYEEEEEEDV